MTADRTELLRIGMEVMVPMSIAAVADWSAEGRQAAAVSAADLISSGADQMWEHNPRKRDLPQGRVTATIARGLAVLAYQPGGVTWAGSHWCTAPHEGCPTPARWSS
ncbi:hypothetical protein OG884_15665 [Streptosporangium sp. NBC_01755]|uniref:hypothetical protein n=1 Tax=Streptosporangium sp. NBC_01755 TaxID=2975949 RepID=UPI002DD86C75|nr:hypothetical protein [Streptosporangium sp. NBC_01755]WSD03271.1 hypothetical protein OG884_15665 [Streptosporangium sp. NBC_01755]